MIYRVHVFSSNEDSSQGYEYYCNKSEARNRLEELLASGHDEELTFMQEHETPSNKTQMVEMLNSWASHPENEKP